MAPPLAPGPRGPPPHSVKLHFVERRVRYLPATTPLGEPFDGPGIDLVAGDADGPLALGAPLVEALATLEPGVVVRALMLDFASSRVLALLAPTTPEADPRGRVVRLAGAAAEAVLDRAGPLTARLATLALPILAARAASADKERR